MTGLRCIPTQHLGSREVLALGMLGMVVGTHHWDGRLATKRVLTEEGKGTVSETVALPTG